MSKRVRPSGGFKNKRATKRARTTAMPVRAYGGSRVPLASRGYRLNNAERKVYDITTTVYPVNTAGSVTAICIPILGTDMTNRIGRKVVVKSIQARGIARVRLAEANTNGMAGPQLIRIIYLVDLQPNGALPAITDVLVQAIAQSPMNLNNRDRFRILSDKMITLDNYTRDTATPGSEYVGFNRTAQHFKMYKKCNQEVIFNATNAGTVADITSGAILQVIVGNQATDGAGGPGSAAIFTRCRFLDN